MAIAIFDRVLMAYPVNNVAIIAFAAAAILIASKMEEIYSLGTDLIAQLTNDLVRAEDVNF